jgi:hypothetical protein
VAGTIAVPSCPAAPATSPATRAREAASAPGEEKSMEMRSAKNSATPTPGGQAWPKEAKWASAPSAGPL